MNDALGQMVYDACHLRGEFVLRSGELSSEHIDKYLFETQPALLRDVAKAMVDLLPECDVLAGMELGGVPSATVTSQLTDLPVVFVRKQAKPYGTRRAVEGGAVQGLRVVVIEDVVTTAGAVVEGCRQLREAGASIPTAICAIDRGQGGAAALAVEKVTLHSAVDREALDRAADRCETDPR